MTPDESSDPNFEEQSSHSEVDDSDDTQVTQEMRAVEEPTDTDDRAVQELLTSFNAAVVESINFDYAVTLVISCAGGNISVRLETPYQLFDGQQDNFCDQNNVWSASRTLFLLRRQLSGARVSDRGQLILEFDDGARLLCEPDDAYEAWTFWHENGQQVVCSAGGAVVVWDENPSQDDREVPD